MQAKNLGERLIWARDGQAWPLRECSRFVSAAGLRWHVQKIGQVVAQEVPQEVPQELGPDRGQGRGPAYPAHRVLLLHGTGAATHSWRGLAPLLAPHAQLLAPDLPGHAFTDPLPAAQCSLPGMAAALQQLLAELNFEPDLVLGHSAGAALMLRMALDGAWPGQPRLVSLNGALMPFEGLAGLAYAPMARLLSRSAWVPRLVARRGDDERAVQRLIGSTGSRIDAAGVAQYQLLMSSPGHVAGALAMMANWDLKSLLGDLPRLGCPLLLLAAAGDTAVPPAQAQRVALRLPRARVQMLPGLGHLAHEEEPARLAGVVLKELALARQRQ